MRQTTVVLMLATFLLLGGCGSGLKSARIYTNDGPQQAEIERLKAQKEGKKADNKNEDKEKEDWKDWMPEWLKKYF